MLVGFLTFLFVLVALFLGLFVLIQQGKGDMGMGSLGGSTQMLFGGSGGQTFFEKTTWALGTIFMLGALGLSVLKSREIRQSRLDTYTGTPVQKQSAPAPVQTPSEPSPTPDE